MITLPTWREFVKTILDFRWVVINWGDGTSSNLTPWIALAVWWVL